MSINQIFEPEHLQRHLAEATKVIQDYYTSLDKDPSGMQVLPPSDPSYLLQKYRKILDEGVELKELLESVIEDSNHLHHPRYVGHQCAVTNPLTAATFLCSAILNNGSAVYEMGPANVAMERTLAMYFGKLFGMPETADGVFTSGGTLGNLTAMLTARQAMTPYDIWEEGLKAGDRPVFLVSALSHYSISRSARVMGLGAQGTMEVPHKGDYRMNTKLLESIYKQATDEGKRVIGLVAGACSTATGTFDDLEECSAFCRENDLWFHVDAAHGGPAIFSAKYRHLLKGSEKADSMVIDFHKMMLTPGLNSLVLYREARHSYSAFAQKADYLWEGEHAEWYNFARRTMECTKSMMGFQVFTQLAVQGKDIVESHIDTLFGLGKYLADMVKAEPELELAVEPDCNIVCFRYRGSAKETNDLNRINAQIRKEILAEGSYYLVQTILQGKQYLRVSLMNPLTSPEDLKVLLETVKNKGKYFT